jgi:putative adenylate-forming enzyme
MNDTLAILWHYARTRHSPRFRSAASLARWQEERFQLFAERVLARSPFYAPYVGRPLADYPLVDKAVMVANFDRMNTKGLKRAEIMELALASERSRDFRPMLGDISVGLSSGTSGNRGLFAASAQERRLYIGAALAKCLPGSILGRHRIALLLRANNTLYETAGESGRIAFRFFDLIKPVAEICGALDDFQPDIVIGPPQSLRLLADAKAAGRLAISPRKIVGCAEVLDDDDAARIAAAFGRPVDQIYQATEGFLGATCRHGTIHLNEDFLHFEKRWIDRASSRFMPIVTDFTRSTQPIVRYRLDDILVERKEPCPCGSVHTGIARIEGRFDDILAVPSEGGGRLVPVLPDFIRDSLADAHGEIQDYRVIQRDPRHIDILLSAPNADAAFALIQKHLASVFARFQATVPDFRNAGAIERDAMRKVRRVERRFAVSLEDLWPAS